MLENSVQCRLKWADVTVDLRKDQSAFEGSQQSRGQAIGIGAPAQVTSLMHGPQPISNRAFPLVESVDQVLATLRMCLEQLSGQASQ